MAHITLFIASILITTLFIIQIHSVGSAKILLTGVPIKSHTFEQLAVAEELVSRGHQVYYAVASRWSGIAAIKKKGIKVLTYQIPLNVPYLGSDETEKLATSFAFESFSDGDDRMKRQATDIPPQVLSDCAYMMEDVAFLETVKRIGFDIAIVEPFIMCPCNLILPKYLRIPFVSLSGYFFPWDIRIPALPSFYPTGVLPTNRNSLIFKHRLNNFLVYLLFQFNLIIKWDVGEDLLARYELGVSSWHQLLLESELFIVTCDHLLDNPLPSMPNLVRVPGLFGKPSQPLPNVLEELLTASKRGVVLMTFGSTITDIPNDIVKRFLDAFSLLNQTVVAKLRVPDGLIIPKNVHIRSWLPQNDILGHANVKLFITHCGNGGQYEALYHAVPMLGFPLFAEQFLNAERAREKGFGLVMDIHNFTSTQLFNNIQEMLTNPSYTTAIRKMSAVLHDEPINSREKASFWIEHVIKHGGKHLRSIAMDMPVYQFLMIDVIALVFVSLLLFLALLTSIIYCIGRKICSKKVTKINEKRKNQ